MIAYRSIFMNILVYIGFFVQLLLLLFSSYYWLLFVFDKLADNQQIDDYPAYHCRFSLCARNKYLSAICFTLNRKIDKQNICSGFVLSAFSLSLSVFTIHVLL